MRPVHVIFLVAVITAGSVASLSAQDRKLAWVRGDDSLALTNHGKVVWQFHHGKEHPKPCFHPLATLDGTVLTDFRPSDHLWHRAAWFSLKEIDDLNYWEENPEGISPGRNETIGVKIRTRDDFSAVIRLTQSYHPPGKPEVVGEERVIRVSAPDSSGSYTLDWEHLFTARKDVTIESKGAYAGLSLRVSKQLLHWTFLSSAGHSQDAQVHGKSARWLTYRGSLESGVGSGSAGLTIFDHPSNPRFPNKWFIVKGMPYFSPAFVFDGPMPLARGESLPLFYRVKVHGSAPEVEALEAEFRSFAERSPELSGADASAERVDLVATGARLHQVYCSLCHSVKPEGEPGKAGPKWYGLIGKTSRTRDVAVPLASSDSLPLGSAAIQRITADDAYVETSILEPNRHLAIREEDPQKGAAYAPSMPPYPHLTPQERRSIIAFMRTLNEAANRGPSEVWEIRQVEPDLPTDRFEVVVRERSLVYRVAMADVSYRALSVGLPGGYNYIFDPSTFTVKRAWAGGFLNLQAERTGRGTGYNRYGSGNRDIGFIECLIPLGKSGPIHQDFKDYINNAAWRIERSQLEMQDTTPFLDRRPPDGAQFGGYRFEGAQPPIFLFRIGGVDYEQRVAFESEEVMHYYFATKGATEPLRFKVLRSELRDVQASAGTWDGDTLSIPAADAAEFAITLTLVPTPFGSAPLSASQSRLLERLHKLGVDRRSNFARGATATSPGSKDGAAIGPRGAVDGVEDTYWDETDNQERYRLRLSLAKPHALSALTLLGYEHHDYAPRDFELVVDEKAVKAVRNAKYDANLLMVEFPRTECHTFELVITSWYGRSPAVRELGLYDLDEAPAPGELPFVKNWSLEELAAAAEATAQRMTPSSVQRGGLAFLKAGCVQCHPVSGQGARNGPDLGQVATKYQGSKLLQQVLEPSSEIAEGFESWVVVASDGRVVTGLMVEDKDQEDDGETLNVMPDPALPETIVRIPKKNVVQKAASKVSAMPEQLASTLTREEILDLLTYLQAGAATAGE